MLLVEGFRVFDEVVGSLKVGVTIFHVVLTYTDHNLM